MIKKKRGRIIAVLCACSIMSTFAKNNVNYIHAARTESYQTTTADRNYIANNWTYYKRGYADYNCLAYALGDTSRWIWPWGSSNPSTDTVKTYLKNLDYTVTSTSGSSKKKLRMVVYSLNGGVTHFSRTTSNTTCRAKWGACELFSHSNLDPYTNNVYGKYCLKAYK